MPARVQNPKPETDLRDANNLARLYRDLGGLHRQAGDNNTAVTLERQRVDLWRFWDRKLPNNSFIQRQLR